MDTSELASSFRKLKENLYLPHYLQAICSAIIDEQVSRTKIEEILTTANINEEVAKVEFLHLIVEYIKVALADDILTSLEKENIKYLKLLFHIQPGNFFIHYKKDVQAIVSFHLSRIYNDNSITEAEALLKIELQEIFDLSYDQMNEYAKANAAISIQNGGDCIDLDVFFTHKEYFQLRKPK